MGEDMNVYDQKSDADFRSRPGAPEKSKSGIEEVVMIMRIRRVIAACQLISVFADREE